MCKEPTEEEITQYLVDHRAEIEHELHGTWTVAYSNMFQPFPQPGHWRNLSRDHAVTIAKRKIKEANGDI